MEKVLKFVKVLTNTLTTIIIIVGLVFLLLYAIGIEPYVVQSGSMEDEIKTGSLSFINKRVKYEDVKEGDIIGYTSTTDKKVLHRIIKVESDGIRTKGDANEDMDGNIITEQNYIGKAIFWVPEVGYAVNAMQTGRGRVILTTVIVAMLVSAILIEDPSKEKKKKNKNNSIKYKANNNGYNDNDFKNNNNTESENSNDIYGKGIKNTEKFAGGNNSSNMELELNKEDKKNNNGNNSEDNDADVIENNEEKA